MQMLGERATSAMDAIKTAAAVFKERLVNRVKAKRAARAGRAASWYEVDDFSGGGEDVSGGLYEEILEDAPASGAYEDFESCRHPSRDETSRHLATERQSLSSSPLPQSGGGGGEDGCDDDCSATLDSLVALHAYAAQEDGQLSFERGELLDVIADASGLWWLASNRRGEVGLVPSNYLFAASPPPPLTATDQTPPRHEPRSSSPRQRSPPAQQPPQPERDAADRLAPERRCRRSGAAAETRPVAPSPTHQKPPTPLAASARVPPASAAGWRASTSAAEEVDGGGECAYAMLDTAGLAYFHDGVGRDQCERLLVRDGDFLLRDSRGGQLTLSVKGRDRIHHFLVATHADGGVSVGRLEFPLFSKLVDYYHAHAIYKSASERLLLASPVCRR